MVKTTYGREFAQKPVGPHETQGFGLEFSLLFTRHIVEGMWALRPGAVFYGFAALVGTEKRQVKGIDSGAPRPD